MTKRTESKFDPKFLNTDVRGPKMAATAFGHNSAMPEAEIRKLANAVRRSATEVVARQGFGYLGQALSSAEIFAVMFGSGFVRVGHDRFILSPGHYGISFYAVAAELGLLDKDALGSYGDDGALLESITTERTPLIDLSCGSLGQGLSGAVGFALASRLAKEDRRVVAFLSDGEMEEGQIWEAAMFAAHRALSELTLIIDANNSQVDGPVSSVTTIEPLDAKWASFGWRVSSIDGRDVRALSDALWSPSNGSPHVIIAKTDIFANLRSVPPATDGHFFKVDAALARAILDELSTR
jgi:transketolase